MSDWETLGAADPRALVLARLELHHAVQLAAAAGATLLARRADDSHPNLGWREDARSLVGHRLAGDAGISAGLRLETLELVVLRGERVDASRPLAGRTLDDGREWLGRALAEHGAELPDGGLRLPGYELPGHPAAGGAPFAEPDACHVELARWFADAGRLLSEVVDAEPGASEVRCWPHHFDLATLITLERDEGGAATRTIGVGLSPGDEAYPEPYWYVTPWPYPEAGVKLPAMPAGGHWRTEGYTAAILPGVRALEGGDQRARAAGFLASAIEACRALHRESR